MGNMNLTANNLETSGFEKFNLALIGADFSYELDDHFDREVELAVDYYESMTGSNAPVNYGDLSFRYDEAYSKIAREFIPDLLVENFPEVFTMDQANTDHPVVIGEFLEAEATNGRELIMYDLNINGEALLELCHENGIYEVHDGRDMSGFIRTADDSYWSACMALSGLMEALVPVEEFDLAIYESINDDGWLYEYIDFGEFGKLLEELD